MRRRGRLFAMAMALAVPVVAAHAQPAAEPIEVPVGGAVRKIVPGSGASVWFKDCAACPEMVVVPAGTFEMSVNAVGDAASGGPRRIGKAFAVARFATTFAEWDACVAAGGCNGHRPADKGWGRGRMPVIDVNFADAEAFAGWLSRTTGKAYRLPTDVEREYFTRAGVGGYRYWWGDDIDLDRANYDVPRPSRRMTNADYGEIERLRRRPVPVDSFKANPWGLYNVHGNVWEWTSTCFRRPGEPADGACGERLSAGGSWNDFAEAAVAGSRIGFAARSRNPSQGFRVVRDLASAD